MLQIPINTHKTLRGPRESQNWQTIFQLREKISMKQVGKKGRNVIWELTRVCKSGDESAQDSTVIDTGVPQRVLLKMLMVYTCELKLNR